MSQINLLQFITNWGIDICKKRVIINVGRLAYNSDKVYLISKDSLPEIEQIF